MRKVYLTLSVLICSFVFAFDSASAIQLQNANFKTNSCSGANVDRVYYISGNNYSRFIGDEFWTRDDRVISDPQTKVTIWQSDSNLLSGCTSASDWWRASTLSPGNNKRVISHGANCTFHKPTDKSKRTLQFVHNVGYYDIVSGNQNWNLAYFENTTQLRNNTPKYKQYNNIGFSNLQIHDNECFNVELRYCGDGLVTNGEVCDPEDPNQTGFGNGGCSTSCQPVNTPACSGLTVVPTSGTEPVDSVATCSGHQVNTFEIDCGNGQVFTGSGSNGGLETFTRTCNYTTSGTYTPTCTVNGTLTNNSCQKTVTVIPVGPNVDIDKTDENPVFDQDGSVGNDTQTVGIGEKAVFRIRVTNNGTEDLKDIVLTDAIEPNCAGSVTLPGTFPSTWSSFSVGGSGDNNDAFLQPGEYFEYTCERLNTTAAYTNTARVDAVGRNSNTPVDDDDPTDVLIDGPSCTNLTATPSTGTNSLSSTVVCTGQDVTSFRIDCGNGATFSGSGSNSGTETFTKTCNYTTLGTFTPTCFVDNTITNNSCQKTVTVTSSSSSSSGSSGGGTSAVCNSISRDGDAITCNGNSVTKYFRLDCGNGTPLQVKQAVFVPNTGRTEAVFDCDYSTEGNEKILTAKCEVTKNNSPLSQSWRSRKACELGETPTFCGDGVIQRPNSNGENEQCEKTINQDGSLGDFPSNCTNSCKFTGGGSSSSSGGNIITIPNHGDIVFGPVGDVIVGHGKNPLEENGEHPFIRNDSDYDLYFDELCVSLTNGSSLDGTNTQCTPLNDILYPGEKVELNPYPTYTGNKNSIPAGQSYGSNTLTTTIRTDGTLYDWAYFAADLGVRVSKPSIATTGGGTSFIKDTSKIADIHDVAIENKDENKNFVGTSISTGNISSYTTEVNDASVVEEVEESGDVSESVEKVEETPVTISTVTGLASHELTNYNGLANVYVLNGANLEIDSIPSSFTGPRTYIVQNADLIITGNLNYSDNIAFVVKGGDIKVDANVTEMSGTYIAIPVEGVGGDIEGIGGNTDNILTVKGSLYGTLTNLIDKRTYVSNDTHTGQINVGTIVSFGSQIFKKPAPLVGQFISEYLASEKVAQ